MLFHDAGHGSLAASPLLNRVLHRLCGVMCWTPCDWRGKHRLHHATAGNLDNDLGFNFNEIVPFTAAQYGNWPSADQMGYLAARHSGLIWLILPFYAWGVTFRLPLNQVQRQEPPPLRRASATAREADVQSPPVLT